MRSRGNQFFNSYDLLGKAIPGIVFLLGIILLVPVKEDGVSIPDGATLRNLAVILVAATGLGLVFGEGVHNLAINIERMFGWFRIRTIEAREFFSGHRPRPVLFIKTVVLDQDIHFEDEDGTESDEIPSEFDETPPKSDSDDNDEVTAFSTRVSDWFQKSINSWSQEDNPTWIYPSTILSQSYYWLRRRIQEVDSGLISHRELFYTKIVNQIEPYQTEGRRDSKYEQFLTAVESEFNDGRFATQSEDESDSNGFVLSLLDPKEESKERLREIYPLITTRLEEAEPMRAGVYQSTYSFCRSMWVVLAILTSLYTSIFVYSNQDSMSQKIGYLPNIAETFVAIGL